MPWLKFRLRLDPDRAQHAADVFESLGAIAVMFEDAGDQPLFAKAIEQNPLWTHTWITGLFPVDLQPQNILNQVCEGLGSSAAMPHDSQSLPIKIGNLPRLPTLSRSISAASFGCAQAGARRHNLRRSILFWIPGSPSAPARMPAPPYAWSGWQMRLRPAPE